MNVSEVYKNLKQHLKKAKGIAVLVYNEDGSQMYMPSAMCLADEALLAAFYNSVVLNRFNSKTLEELEEKGLK